MITSEQRDLATISLKEKPKAKRISPTQRSLALLRTEGWFCAITERWNPHAKIRQDLFGFIDVLCVRGDTVLAVQTTTGDNVSARITKIQELWAAKLWLDSPNRWIMVHGWRKLGKQHERKLWKCRKIRVYKTHWEEIDPENRELALVKTEVPF